MGRKNTLSYCKQLNMIFCGGKQTRKIDTIKNEHIKGDKYFNLK